MPPREKEEEYLPKEHKDLPRQPLDLPQPHHATSNGQDYPNGQGLSTPHQSNPSGIKTLLSWMGPGRPFRKRTKQYYLTALLIMLLVLIILFLFKQFLLMLVVLSLVFVSFALTSFPPRNFHYRISSEGITVEDHSFLWQELYDFYFKRIEGVDALQVRTHAFIPGILTIPIGDLDKNHVKEILLPYLPFRETVRETFMEKAGNWLSQNFPLESPQNVAS